MPRPEHKPESHILAAPVTIEGLGYPIKGIFDGGAETCIMSFAVYMAIDPRVRPTLRASEQQVRGVFGVEHGRNYIKNGDSFTALSSRV